MRDLTLPSDTHDLEDIILTDEGETFSSNSNFGFCNKDGLLKMLRDRREMLKFGLNYSIEDPIAYDVMLRRLEHVDGRYQLPLLWRDDAVEPPSSREREREREFIFV